MAKGKKGITAKQKAARVRNMAIARAARVREGKRRGKKATKKMNAIVKAMRGAKRY